MRYLALKHALILTLAPAVLDAGCGREHPEKITFAPPPYLQATPQIEESSLEKWLASKPNYEGIEIKLWHHSDIHSFGSLIAIRGNGECTRSRTQDYPILEKERTIVEHLRLPLPKSKVAYILDLFNYVEILRLPRSVPEDWPKEMRYSLGLMIPGVGSFEGEHPDIEWSKLPQSTAARRLVRTILELIAGLEERIRSEDAAFLKDDTLTSLVRENKGNLHLELWDIQGMWGGMAIRLGGDGRVHGVSLGPKPGESGLHVQRFQGDVGKERMAGILTSCMQRGTFDVKRKRETGIPDESYPAVVLRASIKGIDYSRSIALFDGEARETPAFQIVRDALRKIGEELLKE